MFGENKEGDIIDSYLLLGGRCNSVGLVYHPRTSKYTCASLELCVEDKDGTWVSASSFSDEDYINIDCQADLNELAKNVVALRYRRKEQRIGK